MNKLSISVEIFERIFNFFYYLINIPLVKDYSAKVIHISHIIGKSLNEFPKNSVEYFSHI